MVNSTTPRLGARWPPFTATFSTISRLISSANWVICAGFKARNCKGLSILSRILVNYFLQLLVYLCWVPLTNLLLALYGYIKPKPWTLIGKLLLIEKR